MLEDSDNKDILAKVKPLVGWRTLRAIGNSTPAKLTITIPLIGYLVLLNQSVVDKLALAPQLLGPAAGSLSRLVLIYFGLVAFAVGSTIYAMLCPRQIKQYASAEDYIRNEEAHITEKGMAEIEELLRHGDSAARFNTRGYQDYFEKLRTDSISELNLKYKRLFRVRLQLYYEMLDRSYRVHRLLAFVCFCTGTLLMLLPSWHVFLKVLGVIPKIIDGSL